MKTSVPTVSFPKDFYFGASTSAYQIEGAANQDGKSKNIWDVFIKNKKYSDVFAVRSASDIPEKYKDRVKFVGLAKGNLIFKVLDQIVETITEIEDADIACDSYNKTDVDIELLKELGVQVYRFSLSWTRILPTGFDNEPNEKAIQHYRKFIDKLIANKITPVVTIYHFDLPQLLQEVGGWANSFLVGIFANYARFVYKTFGDKVKLWTTINEPRMVCEGYGGFYGMAPFSGELAVAYSGIADYMSARNLLLAHAHAYRIYEKEFKSTQNGEISICLDSTWAFPRDENDADDAEAADWVLHHYVGTFLEPLITGEFPKPFLDSIDLTNKQKNISTVRIVPFTTEEKNILIGSYDFMAFNYYRALRVKKLVLSEEEIQNEKDLKKLDQRIDLGDLTLPSIPIDDNNGFGNLLKHISKTLKKGTKIIICENGIIDNPSFTDEDNTKNKIEYHRGILTEVSKAIDNGINVFGYCVWSLMDSFEWSSGYEPKFGIYKVDFNNKDRPRSKKGCFDFFNKLFTEKVLPVTSN